MFLGAWALYKEHGSTNISSQTHKHKLQICKQREYLTDMAKLKKLLAMFALVMLLSQLRVHGVSVSVSSSANVTTEAKHLRGRCHISGFLHGKSGDCNRDHGSVCCKDGHRYPQFRCSPPVSADTPAILTLNSFARGGDGGGKSFCDNRFHKDTELVVALSTGWLRLDGKRRCNKMIRINGNGRAVLAKVVDECDSVYGCDAEHNFEPPCPYNDVDASPAVWKALGLKEEIGVFKITWSDVWAMPWKPCIKLCTRRHAET